MTEQQRNLFHWQKCVDCNCSYFDYKDVFEPSYTDFKFMVPNHSYICTNSIVFILPATLKIPHATTEDPGQPNE